MCQLSFGRKSRLVIIFKEIYGGKLLQKCDSMTETTVTPADPVPKAFPNDDNRGRNMLSFAQSSVLFPVF